MKKNSNVIAIFLAFVLATMVPNTIVRTASLLYDYIAVNWAEPG
jgi:hypothetical protein